VIQSVQLRWDLGVLMKHANKGTSFVPPIPVLKEMSTPVTWDYKSSNGIVNYTIEQAPGGTVKTPMGPFEDTLVVTIHAKDSGGNPVVSQGWYARNYGLVRELTKMQGQEVLMELKSFIPAP
jgi:hypothetical protein